MAEFSASCHSGRVRPRTSGGPPGVGTRSTSNSRSSVSSVRPPPVRCSGSSARPAPVRRPEPTPRGRTPASRPTSRVSGLSRQSSRAPDSSTRKATRSTSAPPAARARAAGRARRRGGPGRGPRPRWSVSSGSAGHRPVGRTWASGGRRLSVARAGQGAGVAGLRAPAAVTSGTVVATGHGGGPVRLGAGGPDGTGMARSGTGAETRAGAAGAAAGAGTGTGHARRPRPVTGTGPPRSRGPAAPDVTVAGTSAGAGGPPAAAPPARGWGRPVTSRPAAVR